VDRIGLALDGVELRSFMKDMSHFRGFLTFLVIISEELMYCVMVVRYLRLDDLLQRGGSDC